jgi:hypothetical protein
VNELVDLRFVAKVDNACVNIQLPITAAQFVAQFVQSFLASRHEHERSCASPELARTLATDSR